MNNTSETIEGFVVDIACLRKYAAVEIARRARDHTRDCALMGHCMESGYALVGDDGQVMLLDSEATLLLIDILRCSSQFDGVKLRAVRERQGNKNENGPHRGGGSVS